MQKIVNLKITLAWFSQRGSHIDAAIFHSMAIHSHHICKALHRTKTEILVNIYKYVFHYFPNSEAIM